MARTASVGARPRRIAGRGLWVCNQCQPNTGDGIEFIRKLKCVGYAEAVRLRDKIFDALGTDECPMPKRVKSIDESELWEEATKERAAQWKKSKPLTLHHPVGKYLERRTGIVPVWCPDLRVGPPKVEAVTFTLKGERKTRKAYLTNDGVLLALFRGPHDRYTIHRTYIRDGKKVETRYAPGPIPAGGAVQLFPIMESYPLGIAEGRRDSE